MEVVGKMTEQKQCDTCDSKTCPSAPRREGESDQQYQERQELAKALGRIEHKIMVLSGKGGVGKSTVAVNLAVSLALAGRRVGLLDIDIHGPSVPKLLNLEGRRIDVKDGRMVPVTIGGPQAFHDERGRGKPRPDSAQGIPLTTNHSPLTPLKVMSIAFLLQNRDDAVIWRGPLKMGVIKQFIKDVDWGELDYLVIDSPPGTGDEPLSICQLIPDADGAVIVTTPQQLSVVDVRKCIRFCAQLNTPVLGVIENMSGFVCPKCGERVDIFGSGGGEEMAADLRVQFLGRIPLDPQIVEACDEGKAYVYFYSHTETAIAFARVIRPILERDALSAESANKEPRLGEDGKMKIAVPVAAGRLSMHFGHCEEFVLVDVDPGEKKILNTESVEAPDHEPGLLPRWLHERGANLIIAGGMGQRAQDLFAQQDIQVIVGAPSDEPAALVNAYLSGDLKIGDNVCDH